MIYKTKADVGKLIQQAIADEQSYQICMGEQVHNSYTWMFAIEHSAEHYAACGVLPREQHGAAGLTASMQQ